jgi:DNA-directed RNA polymerase specialized sigma24 family protein
MSADKSNVNYLAEISEKLDAVLGFMAISNLTEDLGRFVPRLKAMGLSPKAISRVTGITENAVAIRISRLKAASTKKPAKKLAKQTEDPIVS